MAHTPVRPTITLPVTFAIGDSACQAGTITVEPGDTAADIRREMGKLLREAADIIEDIDAEEVPTP